MRLSDDYNEDDKRAGMPVIYMMLGGVAFIIVVIVIVVAANDTGGRRRSPAGEQTSEETEIAAASDGDGTGITAEDLDFWNMYREDEKQVSDNSVITDKSYEERLKELEEEEAKKAEEEDLSEGGTKTKVIRPDGTEQWIMINAFLEKNSYKEEGFVYADPNMKYFADGKNVSYQGLMLDEKDQAVDFALLKEDGISFVMLRMGYRGYESGEITEDKMFEDNLSAAVKAGMMVGVYFESAATTQEEAVEEAEFVTGRLARIEYEKSNPAGAGNAQQNTAAYTQNAQGNTQNATNGQQGQKAEANDQMTDPGVNVTEDTTQLNAGADPAAIQEAIDQASARTAEANGIAQQDMIPNMVNRDIVYPVAIKMGQAQNHSARTDTLPKTMVSLIANSFLDTVTGSGYKGIVWGDKYWLLRRLDLTQLNLHTEVLLEQDGKLPDYPYTFSIWQYQSDGKLSGLKADARMMISFVDYKQQ